MPTPRTRRELQLRHDMMRAKLDGHMLTAADRLQPLSRERQQPAGALRARHRPQLLGRLRRRRIAEIDALIRDTAGQPLFLGAQGRAAASRPGSTPRPSRRCARPSACSRSSSAPIRRSRSSQTKSCWPGRWSPPTSRAILDEAIKILTHALGADKPCGKARTTTGWAGISWPWPTSARATRRGPAGHGAQALLFGQRQGHPRGPDLRQARPDKFARGSRGWLIAEDIITYKIPA